MLQCFRIVNLTADSHDCGRLNSKDKAGAFAIQELGVVIVKKIEGDFFNVMGLPVYDLAHALKKFGVNVI